jgi:hypothetical protein
MRRLAVQPQAALTRLLVGTNQAASQTRQTGGFAIFSTTQRLLKRASNSFKDEAVSVGTRAPTIANAAERSAGASSNSLSARSSSRADDGAKSGDGAGLERSDVSGWFFEKVDENFQTELEAAYERNQQRIQRLFSEPLIIDIPKNDGNWCPDVFVGFSHYDHRRRDEYRQVLAQICGIEPRAVSLSTAWSGRFNPAAFPQSRKVLGVSISTTTSLSSDTEKGPSTSSAFDAGEKEKRIRLIVDAINQRKYLANFHMNAASSATEEVAIRPEDPRIAQIAHNVVKDAAVHRIYILCFSDGAQEGMNELLSKWLHSAQVVPKFVRVADVLTGCSLSTDLTSTNGEPTESFRLLTEALKRLSGGYDVTPTAVVFINGALLGGPREMKDFLRRNAKTLVAALQRPQDIGFKENIIGRSKRSRPTVMRDSAVPAVS